ncbi:hypothetical protein [uncultured Tolumonas sp.]|uniref:hypothetical protein n=1 Tax=uncultured Tolumonas sp. TaxID=263765 RepID=UPI0029310860|nr:hypothetical protein [uncultured Tolumonas sp.]
MKFLSRLFGWLSAALFYVLTWLLAALIWPFMQLIKPTGKTRMFEWLLISIALYAAAINIQHLQIQTGLWKAGHINSAAFIGYWICRRLFGRFDVNSNPTLHIARALIIGACIIGMALGL